VYESAVDAKQALDKLQGFNFQERYLVCLVHQVDKTLLASGASSLEARQQALDVTKEKYGID
jgi:pre-mRNA branch site protein p14